MSNILIDFAVDKVKELMDKYPEIINNPEGFIKHTRGVAKIAEETSRRISENYSMIPINTEELCLAGGLHDLGRPLNSKELGQLGHEIKSAQYIEKEGLNWKIIHNQREAYHIAQIVRPHSSVYEQWIASFECNDKRTKKLIEDFGNINPQLLIPRTWQEAIITYSDLCDKNEERVDPIWKLNDALNRYENDPKIADPVVIIVHKKAMNRLIDLCEKIESACEGKLNPKEINSYFGFA